VNVADNDDNDNGVGNNDDVESIGDDNGGTNNNDGSKDNDKTVTTMSATLERAAPAVEMLVEIAMATTMTMDKTTTAHGSHW
jgi:hypothetical protein